MTGKTIVFVHGNFVNFNCWDGWVKRYEAQGYKCVAVSYPLRDKSVKELRAEHPNPRVAEVTFDQTVDRIAQVIKGLNEKPIIIGHSFGGLLTQNLVKRDLASVAVVLGSVPPPGVLTTRISFFRSLFPVLNPLTPASRPWLMPFEHFQYTFTNGMSLEEQRRAYDEIVVPESVRLGRGGLASSAKIDFTKPHAPLLMIAGEKDNIMPAPLNRNNFNRYKAGSPTSITEFKEFAGRNHYTEIAGKGWEEVADYAVTWAVRQLAVAPARAAA
jgi:pimeloyl-ACP methyl ester carboxylesterase